MKTFIMSKNFTYQVLAASPDATHAKTIEDCKQHFNAYFDELAIHMK
jgi:hypothetical protein